MLPIPSEIVVVGGSLAGLMQGVMLRSLGHNVTILEQANDIRESHMAGVCCAADCMEVLRRFDRIETPFTLRSERLQFVKVSGRVSHYFKAPRLVTSWDALYWRLRANFDGRASDFYPDPPPKKFEGAGQAQFKSRHKVTTVQVLEQGVRVCFKDLNGGEEDSMIADLVIAADGPNSDIRQKYLPDSQRSYSGYVAWRGTVLESDLSLEARNTFDKNVTLNLMGEDHALVYIIPGEKGSIRPGERQMNFLWYTNETPQSLDDIMLDKDGHRHRYIVPSGKVREEVWQKFRDRQSLLAAPHREVLLKIQQPFIQSITDFVSPRAAFEGGRILLVGDALSLYRPHTASSTNQAAFHCLMLERLVKGEIDAARWEREVLEFGNLHCLRSIWYGENYQRKLWDALPSALRYWGAAVADIWSTFWNWRTSKLRW